MKGFTLVEIIIAVLVASLVVTGLWSIFVMSRKHQRMADVTQQGIKEALQFVQPLEQDFRRLYMDKHRPVKTFDGGVEFHVYDEEFSKLENGIIRTKQIIYRHVPDDFAIYRQVGGASPRKLPGTYERLDFKVEPPHTYLTMPPYTEEVADETKRPGGLLTYMVTCLPVELTVADRERWQPQDRTIFKGAVPLTPLNGQKRYYFWNSNPTTRALTSEAELR